MSSEGKRSESGSSRFRNAIKVALSLLSFQPSTLIVSNSVNDMTGETTRREYWIQSFSLAFCFLISALTANNLIFAFLSSNLLVEQMASISGVIAFIVITVTSFTIGQLLFLWPMSRVSAKIRHRDKFLNLLYRSFKISQYVLAILIVLLLSQMIIGFQYYTILLIGILSFSFGMGAIVSCFLSYKIFSWY